MLQRMFARDFSLGNEFDTIFAKASALNTIYATHVLYMYHAAKKIHDSHLDKLIADGDPAAVAIIADVKTDKGPFYYYSFATKYCSFCNPDKYPIFDTNVELVLKYLRDTDDLSRFTAKDLKNYPKFIEIIESLKKRYELTCSYKELDHYLWFAGKEIIKANKKK